MDDQVPVADNAGERQGVEALHNQIVDLVIELVDALLAEVEKGSHCSGFVVAPQQENFVREVQLEGEQSQDHFDAKHASINVVTHEDDVLTPWVLDPIKHFIHVVKLAVDVSYHCARLLNSDQVRFSA